MSNFAVTPLMSLIHHFTSVMKESIGCYKTLSSIEKHIVDWEKEYDISKESSSVQDVYKGFKEALNQGVKQALIIEGHNFNNHYLSILTIANKMTDTDSINIFVKELAFNYVNARLEWSKQFTTNYSEISSFQAVEDVFLRLGYNIHQEK